MIALDIPGLGNYVLTDLVLDINGTLSVDGKLLPGVATRCRDLSAVVTIHLLTADMRGTAAGIAEELGVSWTWVKAGGEAEQKRLFVQELGSHNVAAIGNGHNDAQMLAAAGLGIAVLGAEGTSVRALMQADLAVGGICTALDLLLYPTRIVATLRS
jgi:P-type E1-E2 ATPase